MTPREMDLIKGTLDVLVLRALSWRPMHGYAIARFIHEGSGQSLRIHDGALYTALHRLEEQKCVESEWGNSEYGKRAKFYVLTPAGRRALREEAATWQQYVAAVARVMAAKPETA